MEHLPGSAADRRAPRVTEPTSRESNDLRFLYHPQPVDRPRSHPTQPEREEDIIRSLHRPQSSSELASPFAQPERRLVHKSRSLDKIDPNTTVEGRQAIPPLSHRRSFDGTFPLEASRQSPPDSQSSFNILKELYSTQSPERPPVPENKPLETRTSSEPSTPPLIVAESSSVQPLPGEHPSRPPHSTEIWTPSSARIDDAIQSPDNPASALRGLDERDSNQPIGQDAWIRAFGITEYNYTIGEAELKEYISIMKYAAENKIGEKEFLRLLSEKSTQILQERDQANNRDVETLLKALGIRDDDLGSGNYLEARKYAQTIVRVIRTDGHDKEFNNASKKLLELAPERSWLRSLVNPRKDTIDWYEAAWRNQHAMSKLDMTTWISYIRKPFYQANQLIAGPTNTRSGNLALIGTLAVMGTAYTSYIEGKFALPTLEVDIEYAALARFFYSMLPSPINQLIDTLQFQAVGIGLHKAQASHAQNATTGG